MNDDPPLPDPSAPTPAESPAEVRAAEAAAIRRRWITLGEVLTLIAVAISGLTLWNSWSERRDAAALKTAEAQHSSTQAATLVLLADVGEHALKLKAASAEQSIQSQKIIFPAALGAAAAETTGEPRIETDWFDGPLKKAREAAHLPDNSRGDERLPVVITTRFLVDDQPHEDVALYDIGYTISGRLLGGHNVALRGLSLVTRVKGSNAQAKLDARWRALFPGTARR